MNLTDEQISRWIAEKLGWRWGTRDQFAPKYPDNLGECWWFEGRPYAFAELPRYTTDPAMTVMLLEKLAGDGGFSLAGSSMGFSCLALRMSIEDSSGCKAVLGRAVAEAWMLASGYEEGK